MMRHPTNETLAKLSAAHMGHTTSPGTRAKISAAMMGNKHGLGSHHSEAAKTKISAAQKGNTHWLGHHHSVGTRAKMSAAQMGHAATGPKHFRVESRAKMSVAAIARCTPEWRAKMLARNWKGGRPVTGRKSNAKRRVLGFVQLNAPFVGCEGHHVDGELVINMPQKLHRSVFHRQMDGRGMTQINAIAYNFLFKQEVEAAMTKVSK